MISTVTSKGQVTIPKAIRVYLDIKPSDKIDFSIDNGRVILKSIKTLKNFRGSIAAKSRGDFQAERRQAKAAVGKKTAEEME
jgi:AbrB family looped-hinge helix DNA binding protein